MTFDEFVKIYESRLLAEGSGFVRFAARPGDFKSAKRTADSFVQSLHLKPLGDQWIDLDWDIPAHQNRHRFDPVGPLAEVVASSLAFHVPLFDPESARKLANDFYGLFNTGKLSRLTNYVKTKWGGYGTGKIGEATFEAVHIAMDDDHIGIICLEDED